MVTIYSASSGPSILPRRVSSLALVILLYTAATPFSPISWLTGPLEMSGTYLADRLLAGLILLGACYFQWAVASLRSAVVITLPTGGSVTRVRDGRLEQVRGDGVVLGVWTVEGYWHFALAQAGVLLLAEYAGSETLRRFVVAVVVLALWIIGWAATPASLKRWAWEHAKVYLFLLVLDELRNVAMQGLGGGGGRRRRGRW
ncbi:hypothetical protein C8A05DRAFT_15316 [Staphylotrichum tortipilum]|uniref:Uncharacterized protein n=1 Tax=Staphylotrichum tortipilum TaxID=2831512 RepID=A0AAN6RTQ1_9PEZI|nr:hypothetical protein C8A05DRAFT_15316 [Staphylotrichum longicolle]